MHAKPLPLLLVLLLVALGTGDSAFAAQKKAKAKAKSAKAAAMAAAEAAAAAEPPRFEKPQLAIPTADRIRSVAFGSDSATIAVGMESPDVTLLDARTGRLTQTLKGHANFVTRVAFSPDGKLLASTGTDRTIRVWDLATGKSKYTVPLFVAQDSEAVSATRRLSFSPDGKLLLACTEEGPGVWIANTGKLRGGFGKEPVPHPGFPNLAQPRGTWGAIFAPGGRHIVSIDGTYASSTYVLAWRDAATGRMINPVVDVGEIGFSIEGKRTEPPSAAFSLDGSLLAVTRPLRLYDVKKKAELGKFDHEWGQVVGFTPDNARLIVTEGTSGGGSAVVYDTATSKVLGEIGFEGSADSVALSPDGKLLAVGDLKTVTIWDLTLIK